MEQKHKACAMLFSGGLDTTLEVASRLETYDRICLLTFDNGYCINLQGAVARARELSNRFGHDRIIHKIVNTKTWLQHLLTVCRERHPDYHSPLLVDLACKISAMCALICFAKENNVTIVTDGAAIEQTQIFIQHPEFAKHISPWLDSYGLKLEHPLHFDKTREQKLDMLDKLEFRSGPKIIERAFITSQILHQPFCMRGFITYFFTSPLRRLPAIQKRGLSLQKAMTLFDLLKPEADKLISSELIKEQK